MSEFTDYAPVADAQAAVRDLVDPVTETERLPLAAADGRVLAEEVAAPRAVPHYERAAMDGYAVRAEDVVDASDRSPVRLSVGDEVGAGRAVRVDTGEPVPEGADSVLVVEATERVEGELTAFESVAPGENVAPVGEDVEAGTTLFEAGHRLRPADLGLLKAVGAAHAAVYRRPEVVLIPTGEEIVESDPDPGQVIATNGLTVSRYVERWGGDAAVADIVPDEDDELEGALSDAVAEADVVATLGGTAVGERDRVPGVIGDLGEVSFHGVGLRPGHPVGAAEVDGTPVLMLPGYPVGCLVGAMALLRPAVAAAGRLPETNPPTTEAELTRKIASEPGMRTYARVSLDGGEGSDASRSSSERRSDGDTATPTRSRGSGVLSSVTEADGWVVVPESVEGVPAGETVPVEHWDGWPQAEYGGEDP
ncbi:molybdopterin molybdotransferase MoeA [Halomicrobium urmianum]|uniref:molybdopterin molybdotransferase MoeA n=1 Tax=Halomicrobium urmianum TaxID=1586233 RepID=UPI001CD9727A|nr:gephyrin-like molybdotransferase Glp [Halomicrobium urmianum]